MKKEIVSNSLTSLEKEFYNIPLFGEVHLDPEHHTKGDYDLGEIITNFKNSSAATLNMRAADDGLSGCGIFKGDFLNISLNCNLVNGDIAVVRLGHKTYIRKIYFDKKLVRLETDASVPSPLIIDPSIPDFELVGKVITVIREL